jgi:hypothetical protein
MSKIHGRFGPSIKGPANPEPEYGAPGFKVTVHSGAGTERLAFPGEAPARRVEHLPGTESKRVKSVVSAKTEKRLRESAKDRAEKLGLTKLINASGHEVKLPEGPYMYHRDKQKAALEIAKTLPRGQRGFALKLAADSAKSKRSWAGAAGQPRVPAGNPTGGRWTKK